ncbi:RapZ C-terminal domain-containing protein [Streptomyces jumonjinensis]|uniref:RapZ C-terminal domain-containing protein n=1 Tax=Streptomyces jumonjinensis TaxID=1945 RepID=UPI00379640CB
MITIISFGYGHADPPAADAVYDLRPYRDPHIDPRLRHMTARDAEVQARVLATPGIEELIAAAVRDALAADRPTVIATGCTGGRHRAPVTAQTIATRLQDAGITVTLMHRDLDKPVIQR